MALAITWLVLTSWEPANAIVRGEPVHAISLFGEPRHGPDFQHFDYVNPNAPKGGTIVLPNKAFLTFDSFNPFIIKGTSAVGLGLTHDSLMVSGADEPASTYCLICETVELAPDNTWVEFKLHQNARFSDGSAITPEDIIFSFNILKDQGAPAYRFMLADVDRIESNGKDQVKFHFSTPDNRELPIIIGDIPVLSRAYWENGDFSETTLEPPVSSGPYEVEEFDVGRFVAYRRLDEYWAKDQPVNRGKFNFNSIRYEYFRDDDVRFEAFKKGIYEFRREVTSRIWKTGYDFPAALDNRVQKMEVPTILPMTVQSFFFNLRRPIFQDHRVRRAINYAFDFESLNRTQFYDAYIRQRSYWQTSELEAKDLPGAAERKVLDAYKHKVPPEIFSDPFIQPVTDGMGNVRKNLLAARDLLRETEWVERNGKLVDPDTGEQFAFEIMLVQASLDRVVLPFVQNLERLGMAVDLRIVDTSQYSNRINEFDFDMVSIVQRSSLTPGNELRDMWGSESATRPGSGNFGGVANPVIDSLIDQIINSPDHKTLVTLTRALDRILQWNHYRVLTYGAPNERYSFWTNLKYPKRHPATGLAFGDAVPVLWWHDPAAPDDASEMVSGLSTVTASYSQTLDNAATGSEKLEKDEGHSTMLVAAGAITAVFLIWFQLRRRAKNVERNPHRKP